PDMASSLRFMKPVLAVVMVAFAAAAIYISGAVIKRQDALREVARYNVAWAISQAVNETIRLEERVAAFGRGAVDADEVQLRLEIVASRLAVLGNGEVRAFIDREPEQQTVLTELTSVVGELETLVPHIANPEVATEILDKLTPFEG